MPEPSADQLVPSHLATRLASTPPTTVKSPPIYRLPKSSTQAALTWASAPGMPPMLIQLASLKVAATMLRDEPIASATLQSSRARNRLGVGFISSTDRY